MEEMKKKTRIRFYKSFEEANEADDKEAAAFTPAEHIAHAMSLIKRIHNYQGGRSPHLKLTYIGYGPRSH